MSHHFQLLLVVASSVLVACGGPPETEPSEEDSFIDGEQLGTVEGELSQPGCSSWLLGLRGVGARCNNTPPGTWFSTRIKCTDYYGQSVTYHVGPWKRQGSGDASKNYCPSSLFYTSGSFIFK